MSCGGGLTSRQRSLCRWSAILFIIVGALQAAAGLASVFLPAGQKLICSAASGCLAAPDTALPLEAATWSQMLRNPELMAKFEAHGSEPIIRLLNGILMLFQSLPLAALLSATAMALFGLAREGMLSQATNVWIRRAALAALVMAFVPPLIPSLQASLLAAGTPEGASWIVSLELVAFMKGILLALAAVAIAWAMTAASEAHAELKRFV